MTDPYARTREYTGGAIPQTAVGVACSAAATTAAGQVALLAAVNATVRNHPIVYVQSPDDPSAAGYSGTTYTMLERLAGATSTSRIELVTKMPAEVPVIGIGPDVYADIFVSADRFTGGIADRAMPLGADPATVYGAALGAMLAAGEAFRRSIGVPGQPQRSVSLWTLSYDTDPTGPADTGPIDCGTIWLVGAGGVGSSIAWWLHLFGTNSRLVVIDHELIDLTNLNRTLGAFWATCGLGAGTPASKAALAASLIPGAQPFEGTWAEWTATNKPPPDVLIPAANDLGVRADIATYSHPMALSGTTSRDWTAELHLYRSGRDGCPSCRHPDGNTPAFACSTASVPTASGGHRDAALSFLSGTAGLLTLAALARLQTENLPDSTNHWQLSFDPAARRAITPNSHHCHRGCERTLPGSIIKAVHGSERWYLPAP